MIIPPKPTSDLRNRLMPPATVKKLPDEEVKLLNNFVNLLDRALELDPSKRLTPKEALNVSEIKPSSRCLVMLTETLPSAAPILALEQSKHRKLGIYNSGRRANLRLLLQIV